MDSQNNVMEKRTTLWDKYPMFCLRCGKIIGESNYRLVGIDMTGWPEELPKSVAAHIDCMTAADEVRYKIKCKYCGDQFNSISPDKKFCSFDCEHNSWAKTRAATTSADSFSQQPMSAAVRELLDALKAKRAAQPPTPQHERIADVDEIAPVAVPWFPDEDRKPQAYKGDTMPFLPRNEMGVIFLFGAVIARLGYKMLDIRAAYPDTTIISADGLQIEAEFEYRSSNFNAHGHDPKQCDLVICWIADSELPLPVIDLSRHYDSLTGEWDFGDVAG